MVFRGKKKLWIVDMTLETKIEVNKIILCGMSPSQLIDHIEVALAVCRAHRDLPVGFLLLRYSVL